MDRSKAVFEWERRRQHERRRAWLHGHGPEQLPTSFACSVDALFNVSAYTPGDFKRFFADPRTRAEYLQWAPFMLAAEEWHAGNKAGVPPKPPAEPEPEPDEEEEMPTKKKRKK